MGSYDDYIRSGEEIGENRYLKRHYLLSDGSRIGYPAGEKPEDPKAIFVAIHESHIRQGTESDWCGGWVGFKNAREPLPQAKHELISEDPLTISPSLLCVTCGSHGYIREGKWVNV